MHKGIETTNLNLKACRELCNQLPPIEAERAENTLPNCLCRDSPNTHLVIEVHNPTSHYAGSREDFHNLYELK